MAPKATSTGRTQSFRRETSKPSASKSSKNSSVTDAGVKKPKKSKPKAKPAVKKEIIHVYVNNRLGSRYEIKCSPFDSIGDFKKLVALQSGIKSETILLKRQGTRPLKDTLTLEDYEIGNGSSLDLGVDTTD